MAGTRELEGRVATTLWVVYPPGIATIVPGEGLTERARPMIDYLKMFEKSANVFPGFEAEVQGLYREVDEKGVIRFYTYVVRAVRLNRLAGREVGRPVGWKRCRNLSYRLRAP